MNGQIILPPNYVDINGPLIFLAGPIQGNSGWQQEAIQYLQQLAPACHIASPRYDKSTLGFVYAQQVDWETHHLQRAAQQGAILFWLAKEQQHVCERAYAQTSRFELGEWKARAEREPINLVVGIEDGFSGERYIRHRLSHDCPQVPICNTLSETCQKAVEQILTSL